MRSARVGWFGLACTCVILLGANHASAENKRVVVLEFTGPSASPVRGHVVAALKERDDIDVISSKDAEAARQKLNVQWGTAESYQRVGAELGASAFIEGSVSKAKKKKLKATVRVRDAGSGLPMEEETWTRKSVAQLSAIKDTFWASLGSAIEGTAPPALPKARTSKTAAPTTAPALKETKPRAGASASSEIAQEEADNEEPEEPVLTPSGKSPRHPALLAWLGPRLMWRDLSYGNQDTDLSSYKNEGGSPAFNLALGAQWFPGAHKRGDFVSDFGIEGDFDVAVGLKSRQGNREYATSAYEFSAGALYRLPLDSFEPRFRIGYVRQAFDSDLPASVLLPSVAYSSIRFGLGTGIMLVDWLSIDVNAAYLLVMDAGEIQSRSYAPELSVNAFEVSLALGTYIKEVYGIRLGVDFRRYAFDFGNPATPGLALPEDGSDHYLRLTLAFVYRMPGVTRSR